MWAEATVGRCARAERAERTWEEHDEADAKATLTRCGFDRVVVHRPSEVLGPRIGPEVVRILAAHIEPDV